MKFQAIISYTCPKPPLNLKFQALELRIKNITHNLEGDQEVVWKSKSSIVIWEGEFSNLLFSYTFYLIFVFFGFIFNCYNLALSILYLFFCFVCFVFFGLSTLR